MTKLLAEYEGPVYVRMGRGAVADVYRENDAPFAIGRANVLLNGGDLTIIATGEMVRPALDAGLILKQQGVKTRVIDMHTIKPLDQEAVLQAACDTGNLITVEEHSVHGGLGAAVAELVTQNFPVRMRIMGIPDEPAITGDPAQILKYYRMTAEDIAEAALAMLD